MCLGEDLPTLDPQSHDLVAAQLSAFGLASLGEFH
jgi:hypothetical protein